ncbi:MAG: 2-phospho-L-lactate guanylyltransferase, partial [Novosphingobium sp.]|nr:2-phospho-L-lactate guanylyltransferase [Novosphingobium sp.]
PVKGHDDAKSRLAGALDLQGRRALADAMLAHVVKAASSARLISQICLVGPSRCSVAEEITLLPDPGKGLNPAVQAAFATLAQQGAERVLVIFADLPTVTPRELDILAAAPADAIAIAPDRHGTGTNALSLPLPAAREFRFAFGTDSRAHHAREAARLGLRLETVLSPGLEKDVDEPEDLRDAQHILQDNHIG